MHAQVKRVAFAPDRDASGNVQLATSCSDKIARVWHLGQQPGAGGTEAKSDSLEGHGDAGGMYALLEGSGFMVCGLEFRVEGPKHQKSCPQTLTPKTLLAVQCLMSRGSRAKRACALQQPAMTTRGGCGAS